MVPATIDFINNPYHVTRTGKPYALTPLLMRFSDGQIYPRNDRHSLRNWWDSYSMVAHRNFSNLSNFNFYHFMALHDNKAPG